MLESGTEELMPEDNHNSAWLAMTARAKLTNVFEKRRLDIIRMMVSSKKNP